MVKPLRGLPSRSCQTMRAAPSAVPSSPAAGWMLTSVKGVSVRIFPFITLFRAQPPARARRLSPVRRWTDRRRWKAASSKTACAEAAIASCRGSRGSSGRRAGPSKASSSAVKTRPITGSPPSQVMSTPPVWWRK